MTDSSPITPPPELVQQWIEFAGLVGITEYPLIQLATQAARWGSDQELEACCECLFKNYAVPSWKLRAVRRPKPPSLKEQAMKLLSQHNDGWAPSPKDWDTIRRALEQLDD